MFPIVSRSERVHEDKLFQVFDPYRVNVEITATSQSEAGCDLATPKRHIDIGVPSIDV